MTLTKGLLGIIFVMSLSSCVSAQVLDSTGHRTWASRYTPPAIYEQWWAEIAACEHLPLPSQHKDVIWYIVPTRPFQMADDSLHVNSDAEAAVDLRTGTQEIYVNYSGVLDEGLIKHEELHKLLYWNNGNKVPSPDDHPDPCYKSCGMVRIGQQKL